MQLRVKREFTVWVYAICKNEEQFVDRWVDSMSEADGILVLDTGSTDGTVQRLRARGCMVYQKRIEPWRFDVARNFSLNLVPPQADICVCTDLDEVFEKGWRQKVVDRWVDSMSEADGILVLDTGSTDGTVQRLRERGCMVYQKKVEPWRFDVARNLSLNLVPPQADICVCTDLDEVFEKGWRQKVVDKWIRTNRPQQMFYTLNYAWWPDGTPAVVNSYHSKIHSRYGFEWRSPLHEYVACTLPNLLEIQNQELVLNHYPDDSKDRSDYQRLHQIGYKEGFTFLGKPE